MTASIIVVFNTVNRQAASFYSAGAFPKEQAVWRLKLTAFYPHCPTVISVVSTGGLTKRALMAQLQRNAILLNEAAEQVFASPQFTTAETPRACTTIELTVSALGFPRGAITATIDTNAAALGLSLSPLQLGPHFRLHYLDQPEGYWGQPVRQH